MYLCIVEKSKKNLQEMKLYNNIMHLLQCLQQFNSQKESTCMAPCTCTVHPHTCTVHPHTCTVPPHTCTVPPHTCTVHPHTCSVQACSPANPPCARLMYGVPFCRNLATTMLTNWSSCSRPEPRKHRCSPPSPLFLFTRSHTLLAATRKSFGEWRN